VFNIKKNAHLILDKAISLGWKLEEMLLATTGSVYIELSRKKKEWVKIRISDHEIHYPSYIKIYSVSPKELSLNKIYKILKKPFGKAGDVML
jgi:hypothetical protein